jgi:hypothetical protein
VLVAGSEVREIATCNHERRIHPLDEIGNRPLQPGLVEAVPRAEMKVGHVEDAG